MVCLRDHQLGVPLGYTDGSDEDFILDSNDCEILGFTL